MKRTFHFLKRVLLIVLALILILLVTAYVYMQQPQFGKAPEGRRLQLIRASPHYNGKRFVNLVEKPTITPGYSIWKEGYKTMFQKNARREPVDRIPSIKTDLKNLPADADMAVWFGHSSCLIRLDGKTFLVDPIFSGNASPLPGFIKAYPGTDIYSAADMPEIDYLLITHDHYDHLDYKTVIALKDKIKHVVCGLGVGSHFEHWGYLPEKIMEKDWYETVEIAPGYTLHTQSSHHESGRGLTPGNTLWMSYLIQSPSLKIYISGDGGFDERFEKIGTQFGPIDLAIMEDGQYDKAWQSVHNLPEEVMQATRSLRAKRLLPVHHSKFTLGKHDWDEPLKEVTRLNARYHFKLATPLIGQPVNLRDTTQAFAHWWNYVN